jgi:cytosine/adenosine deaminase-related metal-dependent hydrolase
MRQWIRNPLACLAEGAGGGLVIENGRIAEVVESGAGPAARVDIVFDAGRHVVLPGLINAHHHMYQSLTRAHPRAINKELFPGLKRCRAMAALDTRSAPTGDPLDAGRVAALRLHHSHGSSLYVSQGLQGRCRHSG